MTAEGRKMWRRVRALFCALSLVATAARADDFYAGKTIALYAGQPPGGGIDLEMRLVGQFLGKNIPGEPQIQPRNLPGAGGIALGNQLYASMPADGLTLAMPGRAGFVLAPITDEKIARYDTRKFSFIGSMSGANFHFWIRNSTGVRDIAGLRALNREIVVAGSGSTTANSVIPDVLAHYEGLKFRVVRGYIGIIDAVLAVERGEADAIYCDRASLRPDMISSGLVTPLFQTFAMTPGVPTIDALINEPLEKRLIKLLTTPMRLGLPLIAPPNLQPELVGVLRDAYARMAGSGQYQHEAEARGFDVGSVNQGEYLAKSVAEAFDDASPEVVAAYRSFTPAN